MKNRLLSLLLVISLLCSSLFSPCSTPSAQAASSPTPPTGWTMAATFQKVPLTLAGVTYYAYELKKSSVKTAGGWLVTTAGGNIVSDPATYQKLALTATVSKMTHDATFLPQMKNEVEILKGIRWRIDLYETATLLTKLMTSISSVLTGNATAASGILETAVTSLVPAGAKITQQNKIHDALWSLFSGDVINTLTPTLMKALELVGKLTTSDSEKWLKISGVVSTVLRKVIAQFAEGGAATYQEAFALANKTRSSWSYEDASLFLKEYEEGRTHGLPFAKWYISLIPHEGGLVGSLKNIGTMWWENIIEQAAGPKAAGAMAALDAVVFAGNVVHDLLTNTLFTNSITADIQSADAIFAVYRLTYDPAVTGSLAEQILVAGTPVATTTDKTMYAAGDVVAAKDVLRVRERASATATSKGVVPQGTTGTVIGSSVVADTYRWWLVRWSTGLTGWSAGAYLMRVVAKPAGGTAKDYSWPGLLFYSDFGTKFWRVDGGTEVLRPVFTIPSSISVKSSEVGSGDLMVYPDPTGSNVAIVGKEDGRYAIYLLKSDGTGFRKLVPSTASDIYSCTWSPNGSQLAYATVVGESDSAVWTVHVSGGQPVLLKTIVKGASSSLWDATSSVFTELAWSLDGSGIVLGKGWGKSEKRVDDMYWCPVNSSARQVPYGVRSANGKRVAYRVLSSSGDWCGVRVCDSITGDSDRLVFGKDGDTNATSLFPTSIRWVAWLSDNRTLVAYVNNQTVVTIDVDSPKPDVRNIAGNGFSVTAFAQTKDHSVVALVASKNNDREGLYIGQDVRDLVRHDFPSAYARNSVASVAWSPDRRYVACELYNELSGGNGAKVLVYDTSTDSVILSFGGPVYTFLGWTE